MDRWMYGYGGWMDESLDGWMNGWVVGGIDARMAEVDELRDDMFFVKHFCKNQI